MNKKNSYRESRKKLNLDIVILSKCGATRGTLTKFKLFSKIIPRRIKKKMFSEDRRKGFERS